MTLIMPFGEHRPLVGRDVFIAPNATLIGDVEIEEEASVWFGAVVRGDIGPIRIGPRTNIQDLVCIHVTEGLSKTVIGADVTVGHGAILHGCVVGDRCLIGMGSIVLDNAQIGEGSLVAAGSVVTPNTVIPPRSLVRGAPARVLREVNEAEGEMGIYGARHYVITARKFLAMAPVGTQAAPNSEGRRAPVPMGPQASPNPESRRALSFGNDRDVDED